MSQKRAKFGIVFFQIQTTSNLSEFGIIIRNILANQACVTHLCKFPILSKFNIPKSNLIPSSIKACKNSQTPKTSDFSTHLVNCPPTIAIVAKGQDLWVKPKGFLGWESHPFVWRNDVPICLKKCWGELVDEISLLKWSPWKQVTCEFSGGIWFSSHNEFHNRKLPQLQFVDPFLPIEKKSSTNPVN